MSGPGKNKDAGNESEEPAAPKKSKKKLIVFAVVGVLVLALAGVSALLLLSHKKAAGEDGAVVEEHEEKEHSQPPVYLKLDAFTTNLALDENAAPGTAGQYIQVVVELKLEDAKAEEELKGYMPEIRNNILRLLSSRQATQLASTDGKDQLAGEIRSSVNSVIGPGGKKAENEPSGPVTAVLFSSFVIQ